MQLCILSQDNCGLGHRILHNGFFLTVFSIRQRPVADILAYQRRFYCERVLADLAIRQYRLVRVYL